MQHQSSVRTGLALVLLPAAAALLSVPTAARAQATTGIIEGRVTDAASGRPLPNAQVFVAGTTVGGQTTDAGTFRIAGVPARQVEVRVRLIGFTPTNKTVVVTAGTSVRADFALSTSALQLDQVVVTGTGQRTEVKRLGNTVSVIKPPDIAPINSTSDLLQGREPGVVGMPSSGMTGEGSRIRIRGNSSLSQSNEPIVFIDGIRVNAGGGFAEGVGAGGGGATSRLDDLDPSSIERMEVLKGAAAATLYGTEASNGVIQIFTKRGSVGVPRWSLNLQQDAMQFPDRVAPNAGYPRSAAQAEQASAFWGRTLQPFQVFEVPVFKDNVTEIGRATTAALSVQGGTPVITYFASGRYRGENGPIGYKGALADRLSNLPSSLRPIEDEDTQMQGTINLSIVPTSKLRLGLRSSYINRSTSIPENNNNIYGLNSLSFMARPEQANCNRSAVASPGRCTGEGNIFGTRPS
jgi:TonB-dependent SusC/RagA subfamily outer membrane receptor